MTKEVELMLDLSYLKTVGLKKGMIKGSAILVPSEVTAADP